MYYLLVKDCHFGVSQVNYSDSDVTKTRIDVYETLCPQQLLVHKGGKIKNWGWECRDVTPTNCSLKIYLKRALAGRGGRVGGVRMDVNEELKFL